MNSESHQGQERVRVTLQHVCEALSAWTDIPAEGLSPGLMKPADLEALRRALCDSVFGQEKAIDSCVAGLQRRFQLPPHARDRRPLWTVVFAGASGVGKTKLALALADAFFGDSQRRLVRLDLSELREEHTIARLVGAPPGYKGHGEGGELTNGLRRCSHGVILLDEVEKAHPSILTTVILPMIGEGIVHDMNDGRAMDVTNMIVILATNLGANALEEHTIGFGSADSSAGSNEALEARRAVEEYFPRELLGRLDDLIIFSPLNAGTVQQIWPREVTALERRLGQRGGWRLVIHPAVESGLLARVAPDVRRDGARAVLRLFDKAIVDKTLQLLGSVEAQGGSIVVAPANNGAIGFRIEAGEAVPSGSRVSEASVSDPGPNTLSG